MFWGLIGRLVKGMLGIARITRDAFDSSLAIVSTYQDVKQLRVKLDG